MEICIPMLGLTHEVDLECRSKKPGAKTGGVDVDPAVPSWPLTCHGAPGCALSQNLAPGFILPREK